MQFLSRLFSALTLTRRCVLGLFVRPPRQDERFANWEKTSAGLRENDAGWMYVPPAAGTFTVFPGKQFKSFLLKDAGSRIFVPRRYDAVYDQQLSQVNAA